jgi:hypothetical protein
MLFAASALVVVGLSPRGYDCSVTSELSAGRAACSLQLLESPSKRSRLSHARADESDAPFTLWTPCSDGTALRGKPISMLHDENRAEVGPSDAQLASLCVPSDPVQDA